MAVVCVSSNKGAASDMWSTQLTFTCSKSKMETPE